MKILINTALILVLGTFFLSAQNRDVLTLISSLQEMSPYTTGYVDTAGNIIIPIGKYAYCFTDTFDKVAIVGHKAPGDTQNKYYEPLFVSEGLK